LQRFEGEFLCLAEDREPESLDLTEGSSRKVRRSEMNQNSVGSVKKLSNMSLKMTETLLTMFSIKP